MLMTKEWSARRARLATMLVAALTVAACQDQGASPVGLRLEESAALAKGTPGGGKTDAPGQGKKNSLPIAVSISPTTKEVAAGDFAFFFTTVTNSTDLRVSWSATCGTFSSASSLSGEAHQWTAPGTVGTCTVTATSVADPTKSASATVTVVTPPPPEPTAPEVTFITSMTLSERDAVYLAMFTQTSDCEALPSEGQDVPPASFNVRYLLCAHPDQYWQAPLDAAAHANVLVSLNLTGQPLVVSNIDPALGTCDEAVTRLGDGAAWQVACRITSRVVLSVSLNGSQVVLTLQLPN